MPRKKIVSPFPKRYTDRQWARYLKEGRQLVEEETRIQFKLGDLTLRMVRTHRRDGNHGVFVVLDRFADQIGINVHTLIGYRHVCVAWPEEHRAPGVSWSIHRALDALEDRFELIKTPPEGAERWTEDMALRQAGRLPHRPLTKEEKLDRVRVLLDQDESAAEAVQELIRRPEVAHHVMGEASNQRILYRAHHEQRQQARDARRAAAYAGPPDDGEGEVEAEVRRREPAVDYTRASSEVLELLGVGTGFLVELQEQIPRLHVGEFTEREVRAVKDNNRRIRAALDWCDTVLDTGDTTMDEGLVRILEEGDDLS